MRIRWANLVGKLIVPGLVLGVLLGVGYLATDHKDYPGKAEFETANSLITTSSGGIAYGNTEPAKAAAARFAQSIKPVQAAVFKGGSGRSFATGGEFLTYCRHNPDSVAFLVHVPELRNYKEARTRQLLARLAWSAANSAAHDLPFGTNCPAIIVGLRGFASYGPIWSGPRGGEPQLTTDNLDEKRRLYPFFLSQNQPN